MPVCVCVCVCVILNLSTDEGDAVVPSLPVIPSYNATGMITSKCLKSQRNHWYLSALCLRKFHPSGENF